MASEIDYNKDFDDESDTGGNVADDSRVDALVMAVADIKAEIKTTQRLIVAVVVVSKVLTSEESKVITESLKGGLMAVIGF